MATLGVAMALACGGKEEAPAPGPGPTTTDSTSRQLTILSTQGGSLTWAGPTPRDYTLTLDAPSSMVSVLQGRPFAATAPQPLADWVSDWNTLGQGDGAPHANLKFDRADGSTKSLSIQVLDLQQGPDGKIEADIQLTANEPGGSGIYPSATFEHGWFINDNQHGLPEDDTSVGLFTLTGSDATLSASADPVYPFTLTVTGADHVSGIGQGDAPSLTRHSVSNVALDWGRRFDEPPTASVNVSSGGELSSLVVLRLGPPTVVDGAVTFPAEMVSGGAGNSSFRNAQAMGNAVGESLVTLDSVPLAASTACHVNEHCEGTSTCDITTGACLYATCALEADPTDCAASEQCLEVKGSGGTFNACFPDIGEKCTTIDDCTALIGVPVICGEDGECRPRQCPNGASECGITEQCVEGICYSNPNSITNFANQKGILWGSTWSLPTRQTVCTQSDPNIRVFCATFEQALEDRIVNILETLALSGDDYTYFGRNFFATNTQFGVVAAGSSASFSSPPSEIKDALNAPFGIADTSYLNFSTRLSEQLGGPKNYLPFPGDNILPESASEMLTPFYDSLQTSALAHNPVDTSAPGGGLDPLALKQQYGGGGGFGCYLGVVAVSGDTFTVQDPILQIGGGFGFGVSESTGLDMGAGAGATACGGDGVANCSLANPFIGGGGGKNWRFIAGVDPVVNDDSELATDEYLNALTALEDLDFAYLYCGVGGGLGYQTRPDDLSSKFFASVYGYGGGGNSWTLFRRVTDIDAATHDLLAELDIARVSGAREQFLKFLTDTQTTLGDQSALFTPDKSENAQRYRGILTQDDAEKTGVASILANDNVTGFTYRPFHFEYAELTPSGLADLVLDSHLASKIYMPGSNAPAELFFAGWDAEVTNSKGEKEAYSAREATELLDLVANNTKSVTYEMSNNPFDFDYKSGHTDHDARHDWSAVQDINESTLQMLEDQGNISVTLSVPIFVAHGDPVESTTPLMVSMNQWAIGEAVRLASVHSNITTVVLGTGKQSVRKGFPTTCNIYNFSSPGAQYADCPELESAITYQDYYDLLDYTFKLIDGTKQVGEDLLDVEITRPISVGIKQKLELANTSAPTTEDANAKGWLTPTQIVAGTGSDLAMSLLDFWTLELGGMTKKELETATGLTSFLFQLTKPANVTLAPMMKADLVDWAEKNTSGTNLGTLPNAITALNEALGDVLTGETLSGGVSTSGITTGALLETGWYGEKAITDNLTTLITAVNTKVPDFDLYIDELTDQPWAMLPPTLPGMPTALCGHTFPIPHLTASNMAGPPMADQLPSECAPDYNVAAPNGGQNQPGCLCLTNSTNYPTWFHPFISDVTSAADSLPQLPADPQGKPIVQPLYIPPNSVVTWRRDGNPAINETTFFDIAVADRDGSFNMGAQWKQWPSQLVGDDCLLWNGTPCAPGAVAGDAVPPDVEGELLNGLRCAGVSDAQSGAANANSAMQCPQVWFQFYCEDEKDRTGPICDTSYQSHVRRCPNFIFEWQDSGLATNSPIDQWDLQCDRPANAPPLGSCVPEKLGSPQDATDKGVTGISTDVDTGCVTVRWVGKGSAAKDVTGWQLKTLQAAVPAALADFRKVTATAPSVAENLISFEQTALLIIPDEDQTIVTEDNTVSASYMFCPGQDPATLFPFPLGLDAGQYWLRVQPVGGTGALPSVDAIDMEFDPICHEATATGMNATGFGKLGKFTINYPMPSGVLAPPYSLVESVVFRLPPETPGTTRKTFTITPPVDNGLADFSLPGKPATPATPVTDNTPYTTTLQLNFSGTVGKYGPSAPCTVDLVITAGTDQGDQGGKAEFAAGAIDDPADRCFLEVDNSKKFVNGGNFEFCTNIAPGDADPCGALP